MRCLPRGRLRPSPRLASVSRAPHSGSSASRPDNQSEALTVIRGSCLPCFWLYSRRGLLMWPQSFQAAWGHALDLHQERWKGQMALKLIIIWWVDVHISWQHIMKNEFVIPGLSKVPRIYKLYSTDWLDVTDKNPVQSRHIENAVNVLDRLRCLDHREHSHSLVRFLRLKQGMKHHRPGHHHIILRRLSLCHDTWWAPMTSDPPGGSGTGPPASWPPRRCWSSGRGSRGPRRPGPGRWVPWCCHTRGWSGNRPGTSPASRQPRMTSSRPGGRAVGQWGRTQSRELRTAPSLNSLYWVHLNFLQS